MDGLCDCSSLCVEFGDSAVHSRKSSYLHCSWLCFPKHNFSAAFPHIGPIVSVAEHRVANTTEVVTADKENLPHFQMRLNVFREVSQKTYASSYIAFHSCTHFFPVLYLCICYCWNSIHFLFSSLLFIC